MPTAALRYCVEPGCPQKVPSGRCAQHRTEHRKVANVQSLHHLYRTKRWARLREDKYQENPFCVDCQAEGIQRVWDELDHRIPHGGDLERFWDEANLEGRCKSHHAAKTRRGE